VASRVHRARSPQGAPPLTPTQPAALATRMAEGPGQAGFSGACWRSPMIQPLIDDRFGVFSHVCSSAPWLKNVGFSCQTAALVSAPLAKDQRQAWRTTPGPQIRRRAKERKARLLFGEAASCPPWGTLTSTWARRGQHPTGKTGGKRKGYTVCGLSASCTGLFFYQGQAGRRNSAASSPFLTRVLAQTTPPILLLQDGATYHTRAETQACFAQQTARLHIVQLPPYSPDDKPMEKLWKKSKQQDPHLHYFPTFEALTEKVEQALLKFTKAPEEILALCSLPTALAQAA
jgi:DDE superfamily endonuclease/Winged helix-turn helix